MQTAAPNDWFARWVAGAALFLAVLGFASAATAGPRLRVDNPVWDFGRIPNGTDQEHVFTVRNIGDADLQFLQVRPSCPECLSAYAKPAVLRPGQEGGIVATFDPRFLSGPVTREVYLETNDPDSRYATLTLHAVVETVFEIPSGGFRLGPAATERQARVILRIVDSSVTNALRVLSAPEGVEAGIEDLGDRRYAVTPRLVDPIPKGRRELRLVLGTGQPGHGTCLLVGELRNPDDLELVPETLDLPPIPGQQRRTLWVHQTGAEPMELVAVQASRGDFRFQVEPVGRRGDFRIQVVAVNLQNLQGESLGIVLRFRDRRGEVREQRVPIRLQLPGETPAASPGTRIANPDQPDDRPKVTP